MGRGKQNLQLIQGERSRSATFRKRKEGLKKKAHELKVLCDIDVCFIIYGAPNDDGPTAKQLEIWPPNHNYVQNLIDSYKDQSVEGRTSRSDDLSKVLQKKQKNVQNELLKLRKRNELANYSTWDERYDNLSDQKLREFASFLEAKILDVNNRIEIIKGIQNLSSSGVNNYMLQQPFSSFNSQEFNFGANFPSNHTQQGMVKLDEHLMSGPLMMQRNNNYYYNTNQFGDICSSNFPYDSTDLRGVFADTTLGNFSSLPISFYNGSYSDTVTPYLQYMKTENGPIQYELFRNRNQM